MLGRRVLAAGARAPGHTRRICRGTQRLFQKLLDALVGDLVEDEEAVPAIAHYSGLAEDAELLGDVSLGAAKDALEVADAGLPAPELVENV